MITGSAALAVAALAVPALGIVTLAPSLVFMLLYVWARHNPTSPQVKRERREGAVFLLGFGFT